MLFSTVYPSPAGRMVLGSDGQALAGLWFEGQKYFPSGPMVSNDALPVFAQVRSWLDAYFGGDAPDPRALPLAPAGSDFRKLVWDLLLDIPYGEVTTYGALAEKVARRMGDRTMSCGSGVSREHDRYLSGITAHSVCYTMSAQAVGGAVGHNPISVIIPCHRVVGADGSLTGYAAGLGIKSWLLQHEGAI